MTSEAEKPFKIYKASAGSGKTFTIVKEYLTLCLGDNADAFKEILAVTFTNKAASEMKAKILYFLLGVIEESEETDIKQMKGYLLDTIKISENVLIDRAKRLYINILHNYSDMSVCTIDSFVQRLSRSFARELNLPSQYSVILENEDLVDEIIRKISDEIGRDTFITKMLTNFVEYNLSEETKWDVKNLLGEFIENLLSEDAYSKGGKNTSEIGEKEYSEIKQHIQIVKAELDKSIPLIVKKIEEEEDSRGITDQDYSGKASRGLPVVKKKMLEMKSSVTTPGIEKILKGYDSWNDKKSKITDSSIVDVYNKAIEDYKSLYSKKIIYDTIEKDLYLYVLRNHIFKLIKEYIADSSQVHISEFNKRISDILGDCTVPFIYERIGEKYKHYFIDEFQDTSILQWQNFLPLIENSISARNISLLVGDAKQSIYRFRNSEVEQIIHLPKIYKPQAGEFSKHCEAQFVSLAQKMTLNVNYRSSKNVIKFNNTFFRFAEKYLPIKGVYDDVEQINNPQNGEGFVSVEVLRGDMKQHEYKEKVKASVLNQINDIHGRGVRYKDITILVRSNNDGRDIANYLVGNGVGVVSAESLLLETSDKVQLIVNTMKLVVDEDNAVTKKAVGYYASRIDCADKPFDASAIEKSGGFYDLCMQICRHYDLNIVSDVYLQYFMNMAYDWQSHHGTGIAEFIDYWDKKKGKLSVKLSGDLDCVQIMTIHMAKGLEFKVVIYPYADTMLRSSHGLTQSEMWLQCADYKESASIPYQDAFLLKISKDNLAGTNFESLLQEETNKTMLDLLDIMYVAMTRAKNMLFIYTNDKKPKTADGYNIFTDFFADNLGFTGNFLKNTDFMVKDNDKDDVSVYTYGDFDSTLITMNKKSSKSDKVKILELEDGEQSPKTLRWSDKLHLDADPTMMWAEEGSFRPDEWGLLVHEILSKIITIEDAQRALRPYVNDGTIDDEQAAKLLAIFRKVTEIPELKPAFAKDAVVKNEMDIHLVGGKIIRPDRYAETPQGTILIDYKTGKAHDEYYNQLRDYMSAIIQMNPMQQIKAFLVYIGDEVEVVEVSAVINNNKQLSLDL